MKMFWFLVCAVLCGCASKDSNVSYPIGAILPMKGELASASAEILRGMEIAKDELNARGGVAGVPVRIESADALEGNVAILEAFDKMRRKGVKVFSIGFGKEAIFTKKLVASCDDVFVNYMCSYPPMTLDMPNCVRVFINGAQVGDIMSKFVNRKDDEKVQLVTMNVDNPFGKSDADYLSFQLKVGKTKNYRDVFGEGEKRFDIFGEQIMRLYADCVFYVGYGSELKEFAESLARAGYEKSIVANCGLLSEDFSIPKKISLYQVETLFEQGKIDTPASKRFVSAYEAKYEKKPSWKAAYGYDSVMLLASAAEKSRFTPSKMREQFKNLKYEGAVGKIEFDSSADSLSEMSLVKK